MSEASLSEDKGLEVRTYFVRGRNALLARAYFEPLYVDYYLHLSDLQARPEPEHDRLFKEALAALTLHCASKPHNEVTAWTMHFQNPLINIFVSGNNQERTVIGQLFTQDIKETTRNLFYSDVVRGNDPLRRSAIDFDIANPFRAAEKFYAKSEQRPSRFFEFSNEDYILISAQPDCDLIWLESLRENEIRILDQEEELSLLETRWYHWQCGCNREKLLAHLAPAMKADAEALFQDETDIRVSCPRCGIHHIITREALENFLKANG